MKFRSVASLIVLIVGGVGTSSAQEAINIADLVLAVRNGLIDAQRREKAAGAGEVIRKADFQLRELGHAEQAENRQQGRW